MNNKLELIEIYIGRAKLVQTGRETGVRPKIVSYRNSYMPWFHQKVGGKTPLKTIDFKTNFLESKVSFANGKLISKSRSVQ